MQVLSMEQRRPVAPQPDERLVLPAVELRGIHKRFGAVHANRGVDLVVRRGSIHGIVGENGAGKSTLMSVLYGFHEADQGAVLIDGRAVRLTSAQDAIRHGIGMVHQHFMLVDRFTVLENILLGMEGGFRLGNGMRRARQTIERLSHEFGLAVDLDARVCDLPVSAQQRVEILKTLYRDVRVLILDEPTAVLTPSESQALFSMLTALKARGVTILIVTHKLKEILALTDRVTVMRAGAVVGTLDTANTSEAELGEMMVGRRIAPRAAHDTANTQRHEPRLTVESLTWRDAQGVVRLSDVSFELRAGEVLGVAGVSGNGQSELLELLFGLLPHQQGCVRILGPDGTMHTIDADHAGDPKALRRLGIAHVPEDRHRRGLVLGFSAWESAVLGYQDDPALGDAGLMSHQAMRSHCTELMASFDVRPRNENLASSKFSGGNQQKLVLAREFASAPRVLLIGQPTRGVDIGAIELIHQRLREQRDRGCAVLLVSSELDEILSLSDRVMVMSGGRVTGMLQRHEADERTLGRLLGQTATAPIRRAA